MSYHDRLLTEINDKLNDLAARRQPWIAKWVAHEICNDHAEGLNTGEDADFWRHCGYLECRDLVRRTINSRAGDKPARDTGDPKLPGFEHLQSYYVIRRDEEDVGVPVAELTDTEIDAKATVYRAMGTACFAHARELERFKRLRTVEVA